MWRIFADRFTTTCGRAGAADGNAALFLEKSLRPPCSWRSHSGDCVAFRMLGLWHYVARLCATGSKCTKGRIRGSVDGLAGGAGSSVRDPAGWLVTAARPQGMAGSPHCAAGAPSLGPHRGIVSCCSSGDRLAAAGIAYPRIRRFHCLQFSLQCRQAP